MNKNDCTVGMKEVLLEYFWSCLWCYTYVDWVLLDYQGGGRAHGKSPHFAVYFIQNDTKLKPPQTLGTFCSNAFTVFWLKKKNSKIFFKKSYLIDGPIRPPAGRIG